MAQFAFAMMVKKKLEQEANKAYDIGYAKYISGL